MWLNQDVQGFYTLMTDKKSEYYSDIYEESLEGFKQRSKIIMCNENIINEPADEFGGLKSNQVVDTGPTAL